MEPQLPTNPNLAAQNEVLERIVALDAERSRLRIRLEQVEQESEAARSQLAGLQEQSLQVLLDARMTPLLLSYSFLPDGYILVAPMVGGEIEYAKFSEAVSTPAQATINEVLYYLNETLPWSNIA